MCRKIAFFSIVTSKKHSFLIFFIPTISLFSSAFGADEYVWTGNGLEGNWGREKEPQYNSGTVSISYSEENNGLVIAIPAGCTADQSGRQAQDYQYV